MSSIFFGGSSGATNLWFLLFSRKKYFVEEGTVEFSNNKLLILTSTARDLAELDQNFIEDLLNQSEKKLSDNNSSDKEKYLLTHKISVLKEISR